MKKKKSRRPASTPPPPSMNGGNADPGPSIAAQEAATIASALTHDMYLPLRESLNELEQKSTEQLDKAILQLAVAALGVTIMFRDNLAPNPALGTLPFLFLSWIALVGSIIAVVVSHRASQKAIRYQRNLLDTEMATLEVPDQTNPDANRTDWWNSWALGLFVAGLILLLIYSGANLLMDSARKAFPPDDVESSKIGDQKMTDKGKGDEKVVPKKEDQIQAVPGKKGELHGVPRGDVGDPKEVKGGAVPPSTPVIRERPAPPPEKKEEK